MKNTYVVSFFFFFQAYPGITFEPSGVIIPLLLSSAQKQTVSISFLCSGVELVGTFVLTYEYSYIKCKMPAPVDYQNQTFGLLTAIRFTGRYTQTSGGNKKRIWLFQCSCGKQTEKVMEKVVKGWVSSCGCLRAKQHWGLEAIQNQVFLDSYSDGDLTLNQFITLSQQPCFWCSHWRPNVRCHRTNKALNWSFHGLDRLDHNQPHNHDNVVRSCWFCNNKRSNTSFGDFMNWINDIYHTRNAQ